MEIQSTEPKVRYSNIELLRIISILLIIMSHIVSYGVMQTDLNIAYTVWSNGLLINRIISVLFIGGGDVGVGIFFIITGYFSVLSSEHKKIFPIVSEVFFYSVFLSMAYMLVYRRIPTTDLLRVCVLPVSSSTWWYVSAYLFLVLMIPSINEEIKSASTRNRLIMLIFLWIMGYGFGKVVGARYVDIVRAICFYVIGAEIRLDYKNNLSKELLIFIFLFTWTGFAAASYIIGSFTATGGSAIIINLLKAIRTIVFGPVAAVVLFVLFNYKIQLKLNLVINKLASCTLGVYVIHEFPLLRNFWWDKIFSMEGAYMNNWFFIWSVGACLTIFALGIMVEQLRKTLFRNMVRTNG